MLGDSFPDKNDIFESLPDRVKPLVEGGYYTLFPSKLRRRSPSRFEALYRSVDTESPTIIDGGAHEGSEIGKFLDLFGSPDIHAVEPIPAYAEMLEEKYRGNSNVTIHNAALGETNGEIELQINSLESMTSVLQLSNLKKEYAEAVGEESKYDSVDSITVPQVPIDSLVDSVDIIKLDIQGYELHALKGAEAVLDDCRSILVETSFHENYEGRALFPDVNSFLSSKRFHVFNLYGLYNEVDGQLSTVRAVFFNEHVYENEEFVVNPFEYTQT